MAGLDEPDRGGVLKPRPEIWLSAAGRLEPRRPHGRRRGATPSAAARYQGRDARPRAPSRGQPGPRERARGGPASLQRAAGSLSAVGRIQIELESRRCCGAWGSAGGSRSGRSTSCRAAGRCGGRWPSCSRPTGSAPLRRADRSPRPRRSKLARRVSPRISPRGDRRSVTTGPSSMPWSRVSRTCHSRTITDYPSSYSKYVESETRGSSACEKRRGAGRGNRAVKCSSIASVIRRPKRHRYRAASRCSTRSRLEVPPERHEFTSRSLRLPRAAGRARSKAGRRRTAKAGVRPRQPAHRARRSHRPRRPQRGRQIHAHADAVGRRGAKNAASAPRAIRSSRNISRRTKPRGSIRRSPFADPVCQVRRRHDDSGDSRTFSAGSCFPVTTSTRRPACSRAASARGSRSPACCCVRPTRCCWTSRPITSTSTPRKCS